MIKLNTKKTTKWTMTSLKNGDKITFTSIRKDNAMDAFRNEIENAFESIPNAVVGPAFYQIDRFDIVIENSDNPKENQEIKLVNDNLDFTNEDTQVIKTLLKNLQIKLD